MWVDNQFQGANAMNEQYELNPQHIATIEREKHVIITLVEGTYFYHSDPSPYWPIDKPIPSSWLPQPSEAKVTYVVQVMVSYDWNAIQSKDSLDIAIIAKNKRKQSGCELRIIKQTRIPIGEQEVGK